MNRTGAEARIQKYGNRALEKTGVLVGFDYGRRHIGVAVGQTLTGTATALETLQARNGIPDWEKISALLQEWQPDSLVVGIPYHLDGSTSKITRAAEDFAQQLESRHGLPVHREDERLTSREAESVAAQQRKLGRIKRKDVDTDKLAAQIILQAWLDRRKNN